MPRTEKFHSSSYPNYILEWNTLGQTVLVLFEIKLAPSVVVFKKMLLTITRPSVKYVFGIGLSYISQLRVGLNNLKLHKYKCSTA